MTEIRPSTISGAGNGLFATRNYNIGDIICEYEGTLTCSADNKNPKYSVSLPPRKDPKAILSDDEIKTTKFFSIVGDPKYHSSNINDAVHIGQLNYAQTKAFFEEQKLPFAQLGTGQPAQYNVEFHHVVKDAEGNYHEVNTADWQTPSDEEFARSLHVQIRVIKPIVAGEELFISYGFRYWFTHIIFNRLIDYSYEVTSFSF
jgi:hypothetical protein